MRLEDVRGYDSTPRGALDHIGRVLWDYKCTIKREPCKGRDTVVYIVQELIPPKRMFIIHITGPGNFGDYVASLIPLSKSDLKVIYTT